MELIDFSAKSLYVHIPFCKKICPYCDFIKVLENPKFIESYMKELQKDISFFINNNFKFNTIYIGGGTPSILSDGYLEILLSNLSKIKDNNAEFTIECNPESLNENKLKIFKKYEVNRISIGLQTFKKSLLKTLDRDYSIDYFELINLVKKYIKNINVDFIYGLPKQKIEDVKEDLDRFINLNINHVSLYSLQVEKNTDFYNKGIKEISSDKSAKMYNYILKFLEEHGFKRYEVSNFAKPGYESRHNLTYWKNKKYYAIGIGASGYVSNIRYKNSGNLSKYIKGLREKEEEILTLEDERKYYLICNLRLADGFNINEYNTKFNKNFLRDYEDEINFLSSVGAINIENNIVKCTNYGLLTLNLVLEKLL